MYLDGDEIHNRRNRHRKTQADLARRAGVSASQISKIETEQAELNRDLVVRIEHALRFWDKDGYEDRAGIGYKLGAIVSKLDDDQLSQLLVFAEALRWGRYT